MLQTWIRSFIFLLILIPCFCTILPENNPFIPSIPQLLKGVTNCDVRIFWDGLQDFQYDLNSYLPTISIFAPGYFDKYKFNTQLGYQLRDPKKVQFALNIHQTRIQPCMINLLLIDNETLLQTPTHDTNYKLIQQRDVSVSLYFTMAYNNYLQFSSDELRWCTSLSNIYTVLVTNFNKLIKQNKIKLLAFNYNYVEYFAIIFPTKLNNSGDLRICVATRTLEADLSKTICESFNAKQRTVVEFIHEKGIYSPYWYYRDLRDAEAETDPFDPFSNKSIDLYILNLAAERENKNITVYTVLSHETTPNKLYSTFPTITWWDFHHTILKPYRVFVQSTGLKWLTCYEKSYIGFGFYVSPFEPNLWIGFLITMISVIGISWIYTKLYFKDSTSMSFSPWLFVLGTIFEETSSAPAKIERKTFYRLSIGIWCLMVAILTNCYNGLMITGLNSPLPGIKIESFEDLLCDRSLLDAKPDFNMTQWLETSKIDLYWNSYNVVNPYESRNCFRIWSPELQVAWMDFKSPSNSLYHDLDFWYSYLKFKLKTFTLKTFDSLSYSEKIAWSFLHPGHGYEPEMITKIRSLEKRLPTISEINTANQLEIINCPQKSAYIGKSKEIAMELDFLSRNYNRKKFYMEKDLIYERFEGLAFSKMRNTKIPSYYRILIDSGIYGRLMVEKMARENRFRKPVKIVENLKLEGVSSLEGGLVTLFILCVAVISLAGIAFCFECRRIIWETLRNGYKKVLKAVNALKILAGKRRQVNFQRQRKVHVEIGMIQVKPK